MDIRTMRPDDIDAACKVVAAAGMSTTRDQLALCVEITPQGYFAAWEDEHIVGTVGALSYAGYAFIGAMAIHPAWQRRGIGKALFKRVLEYLDQSGVSLAVLEASDAGFPLYRSFGFVESYPTVTYRREQRASDLDCQLARDLVEPLAADQLDEVLQIDARGVGTRRDQLLAGLFASYPGRGLVARGTDGRVAGYALATPNRIGPWIATDARSAEALLDAALTLPFDTAPVVALPGPNSAGAGLLLRAGFSPQHSTRRMWRGHRPPEDSPTMVYGLAALGLG